MRGFGGRARRGQLKDYIAQEKIDIVGIQETIKHDFIYSELQKIAGKEFFQWSWLPAKGKSRGILKGVKGDSFEIEEVKILVFFVLS